MVPKLKVVDLSGILFKCFYFMTKANGLLPITVTFDPLVASNSFYDVLYSIFYTLTMIVSLPYVQSNIIEFVGVLSQPKLTIIFVFLMQVFCSWLRVVATYLSQVFNYKNLSHFINHSMEISERIIRTNRQKPFLDAKLSNWCYSKFISTIFQVACMLAPSVGFITMIELSENYMFLIGYLFVLYTHLVLILSTGIYFGGMIVIGQFYRNLNGRIVRLQKKFCLEKHNRKAVVVIGMQEFCNLSDEFDQLTALYRDITNHATDFNKSQRFFTFFSLTQYFVIILAEMFDVYTQIMRNINQVVVPSMYAQLLKEFGFISFYVIELYYTIRVTSFVQNEARKTADLLRLCTRPEYDVRLRTSIEALSLDILIHPPKMTVLGLFEINNSLLFGMVATFASYLIILVQFVEDEK